MERNDLFNKIKLVLIIALIIGIVGVVTYLIYGFALLWQAMAATVIIIFLAIVTILFLALSIYLWIKNLMLKREVNQYRKEIDRINSNLKDCNKKLKER